VFACQEVVVRWLISLEGPCCWHCEFCSMFYSNYFYDYLVVAYFSRLVMLLELIILFHSFVKGLANGLVQRPLMSVPIAISLHALGALYCLSDFPYCADLLLIGGLSLAGPGNTPFSRWGHFYIQIFAKGHFLRPC
ncbi:hypothetical protein ACJX0J_008870, partial [Zea mays]